MFSTDKYLVCVEESGPDFKQEINNDNPNGQKVRMTCFIKGFTKDMMAHLMYSLEGNGEIRTNTKEVNPVFWGQDLPPVDGCKVNLWTLAIPFPFVQVRKYLMISFYEWKSETDELIIANTTE